MEVLLCERVNDFRHSLFHLLNCLITTASELRESPKVTGSKVWTIGRGRNCLDAHLGQIVCVKNEVVDWCIVLVEMPLTRLKSARLFQWNIFLNSLKTSTYQINSITRNEQNFFPLHFINFENVNTDFKIYPAC